MLSPLEELDIGCPGAGVAISRSESRLAAKMTSVHSGLDLLYAGQLLIVLVLVECR